MKIAKTKRQQVKSTSLLELLPDLVEFGVTKGVACYKTEVCVDISVGF